MPDLTVISAPLQSPLHLRRSAAQAVPARRRRAAGPRRPGRIAKRALRPLCLCALTLSLLSPGSAGCSDRPKLGTVTIHASEGAVGVRVELAVTRDQISHGLMWRSELAADTGMLFVFAGDAERSFWMRNTALPLDIVFLRATAPGAAEIVSIAANTVPYSETPIPSHGEARYVLEVNAGFARAKHLAPGQRVALPALPEGVVP